MKKDSKPFLGENIIFINSGGEKKKFTLERAKKIGVNIILVNAKLENTKNLVSHFIQVDTDNHNEVLKKLHEFKDSHPDIPFNGAVTFWENDVQLLAKVCEEFDLPGNSLDTAIKTRSKFEMRKRLQEVGLGSAKFQLVKSLQDVKSAIDSVGFPAIMKPVWGADSEFVVLVKTEEEAKATWQYLVANCNENYDSIFKFNEGSFLFEEYLDGMEISLECFSQYGIPNVIGINEKQPIKPPYFIEYGDIAPARISSSLQQEAVKLAESSLIALGVGNSLAHIEMKLTSKGPKIVEVGSRMGGDDIYFNVKHVWGVDMVDLAISIALGKRCEFQPSSANEQVICRYLIPETSGIITTISGVKELKAEKDIIHSHFSKQVGDPVLTPPAGFDNMGWIVVRGKTYQEAETTLNRIMEQVKINITPTKRDSVLGKTVRKSALSKASLIRKNVEEASKIAKVKNIEFKEMKNLRVGILTNFVKHDHSSEDDIDARIMEILKEKGYQITLFNLNDAPLPFQKIEHANLDIVINLCESRPESRFLEPQGASLLEMMHLPYTGNSAANIALCADKIKVKKILEYHEIPTPAWDYVENITDEIDRNLKFPLIVKPANQDNFCGISNKSIVTNRTELENQVQEVLKKYGSPVLVEEYIEGDELDVSIWGNEDETEVLPLIRSIFTDMPKELWHIYSSDIGGANVSDFIHVEKPARVSQKQTKLLSEVALDVYNAFDCRDYAKVEMRIDKNGNPFVLEINPNPPLSEGSFFIQSAQVAKYKYPDIIEELLWMAVERYKRNTSF